MKWTLSVLLLCFPWVVRRVALNLLFGYRIHSTARIGFSIICPERLEMGPRARIGNLTICKGIELLRMEAESFIGNLNWITGFPLRDKSFFSAESGRRPELIVERHAAITTRHYIDCTNLVHVGEFATFAGARSQLLTHSIDLTNSRQSSEPVSIGRYCFVGTGSILLSGSVLPDYCVLGASSLLNKAYEETHVFYAGNPAKPIKTLPRDMQYFLRTSGFVN
jgi:acetyltransferase-like isoleucine patch superfamily enzyme